MIDFKLLLHSTARMYQRAAVGALRALALNWRVVLVQVPVLLSCFLVGIVAALVGGLVGGFILGLFLAFVVAQLLVAVAAGVDGERLFIKELLPRAVELWGPVIGVLFVMFILQWVSDLAFRSPSQMWLRMAVNLLIAVLFNPLPEVIYQRPQLSLQMFGEAYQFMLENFIEWVLPMLVIGGVIYLISPEVAITIGTFMVLMHPLRLIELLVMYLSAPAIIASALPLLIAGLLLSYLFLAFRGVLFRELAGSTRRKRMYQEKFR